MRGLRIGHSSAPAYYYSTFPADEDPISEGGIWLNGNVDSGGSHQAMETANGRCFTSVNQTDFDDAICLYNGNSPTIGNDHQVTATAYVAPGYTGGSGSHELILVTRGQILGTNNIPYYEWLISLGNSFSQVMHQSGPEAGYTNIREPELDHSPADGDVFRFRAVGSGASLVLTFWQNDILIDSFTPTSAYRHNTGKPGLSAFVTGTGVPASACWADVRVENV